MEQDNGSSVGWFLAGTVVGAAIALLYAPQSGRDTRKYIGKTALDSRAAMEASGKEMMERGKELYERGRKAAEEASDLFDRGRKAIQG